MDIAVRRDERTVEGKWLIADRDLNEREGLKWLLKTSSIPVTDISLAADFQEFILTFEKECPDIVLMELDMITKEEWSTFRDLMHIYDPILLLTSAEATFERARLAIEMQALDLMIKPFSTTKVKTAFQKASRKLGRNVPSVPRIENYKELTYEALFIPQTSDTENFHMAAFQSESIDMVSTLHSFLADYPFNDLHGSFVLTDMVILLFKEKCHNSTEQCQKAMRKWEEEFSDPLGIVVYSDQHSTKTLNEKYSEVRKMLDFTYYKGYRQVVEFKYSLDWEHMDPFLAPPEQRDWVDMLNALDIENIKKRLYDEFLQLKEPYPDPGLVRIRLTSILAQIRRFMKTYQLNEDPMYEKEYRTIFNSILYDTVLYRTVQNLILFIQKIFHGAELMAQSLKQDPIERGISFMESNFSNRSLRLEDVAQYVDRNPSYFSHLLITKMGSSFTEVLTGIRLKEATRLLIETRKPVKEIAILVGYQNANYFSRMFRESYNMSPREFRMQKMNRG
ncbi:two-component system response regulator YesN [Bacillus sp. SORGH_AS 510]|uniref:helix-turn-helix domain-containing protein n=1 Tax=Bacillus sp. SORGH_AS_0510 TaxID=3041771 RepID=UPI00278079FE|nr:helix-turn-helix domain-containing protein [Bacillus sp. SORGH_AS_0510]MDQ1146227.1 two-component system response regulator YesN [Bacillus sp. SORGH_AS_0510]